MLLKCFEPCEGGMEQTPAKCRLLRKSMAWSEQNWLPRSCAPLLCALPCILKGLWKSLVFKNTGLENFPDFANIFKIQLCLSRQANKNTVDLSVYLSLISCLSPLKTWHYCLGFNFVSAWVASQRVLKCLEHINAMLVYGLKICHNARVIHNNPATAFTFSVIVITTSLWLQSYADLPIGLCC